MDLHSNIGLRASSAQELPSVADRSVLRESAFRRMLSLERKRAERSRTPFLLTLLKIDTPLRSGSTEQFLGDMLAVLASITRETDVTGWYQDDLIVGVMFTEIATKDRGPIVATIMAHLRATLRGRLTSEQFSHLGISSYVFPEDRSEKRLPSRTGPPLYSYRPSRDEGVRLG